MNITALLVSHFLQKVSQICIYTAAESSLLVLLICTKSVLVVLTVEPPLSGPPLSRPLLPGHLRCPDSPNWSCGL